MIAALLPQLPVLPVVIPLIGGASILLLNETRRAARASVSLVTMVLQWLAALALLALASGYWSLWPEGIAVYAAGGWAAPFGIVLVVDRLSALMLLLNATLALAALVYARARWDRSGVHFHPLFQFLLMGLNGAFLTGDVFNLFVFFEVLLAASYGLVLHGSGAARVKAGLHYIVVNLAASLLFLIGAALIYGVTGTLNMADLAQRVPTLATDDRLLFEIGAAILGVVFLVKAGAWPLNFWLAPAYSAAAAPVAAMFSMMTKVGFYALLRIGSLLAPDALTPFTGDTLFYGGIATLVFGILGILAAQELERVAAFCIVVSAGILLASLGLGGTALTGPLLFYMLSTVLATGAFFLLIGMIDRRQAYGAEVLAVTYEAFGFEDPKDPNEPDEVIGIAIPGAVAFLGMSFLACVLLVAGLPPLSGFVAKFMLLAAALSSAGTEVLPSSVWLLLATVLASGLACVIALSRIGIRVFWSAQRTVPRLRLLEAAPVAALVLICIVLAVKAGPVMQYLDATAQWLHDPATYINAVLPATLPSIPAPELAP